MIPQQPGKNFFYYSNIKNSIYYLKHKAAKKLRRNKSLDLKVLKN